MGREQSLNLEASQRKREGGKRDGRRGEGVRRKRRKVEATGHCKTHLQRSSETDLKCDAFHENSSEVACQSKCDVPELSGGQKTRGLSTSQVNPFLRSWVWKREGKPDRDRFEKPYIHPIIIDGTKTNLTINQRKFQTLGFASTVWDSSIVLAKYFEKHPNLVLGKKCIELGSGCGLVGLVLASLQSSSTILTDLPPNLPLLESNRDVNGITNVSVDSLTWGSDDDLAKFEGGFDLVVATDVMYDHDSIGPLVHTLVRISHNDSFIYLAYGRNRWAQEEFFSAARSHFSFRKVSVKELDEVYHCVDVDVYCLRKL